MASPLWWPGLGRYDSWWPQMPWHEISARSSALAGMHSWVRKASGCNTIDSFTVSMHSRNGRQLPVVRAVQETVSGFWNRTIFQPITWAQRTLRLRHSQPMFRPANHKLCCQTLRRHISYPVDSPTATRLELCSSLEIWDPPWAWILNVPFSLAT